MNILRIKATIAKTGVPRATIYLYMKNGTFPKPIKLGIRSVGWIEAELDEWLKARKGERA